MHRWIETGPNLRSRIVVGVAAIVAVAIVGFGAYAIANRDGDRPAVEAAGPAAVAGPLAPPPGNVGGAVEPTIGGSSPAVPGPTATGTNTPPYPGDSSIGTVPPTNPALPPPARKAPPHTYPPAKPPPPPPPLTAKYNITRSFDSGFVTEITVTNKSGSDQSWRVTVAHANSADVAVLRAWSAEVDESGSTIVFTGPILPPGGSQTFGYEATKQTPGFVRPTRCTVNGSPCAISS
jgi:hypothetical protein